MKTAFTKIILSSLVIGATAFQSQAATIYSNSDTGSDGSGDGSSGNPYQTFHQAYTMSSSGDTLHLVGTFDWTNSGETGDVAVTGYTLLKNLTIIGEGVGSTYIQAASTANSATSCVFTINQDINFQNLTIRYGYNVNQAENSGGITVMDNTRNNIVTFDRCSIEYNRIDNGTTTNYNFAGGIYLRGNTSYHPNVTITNTTFHHNSANGKAYGAGALYSLQSNTITINGSTFHDNSGTDGSNFGVGYHNVAGAIGFFRFNTVKVTNSTFTANSAETSGGAILCWYNYTYLTNNTIAWNTVTSASGKGGGVYLVFFQQSPGQCYLENNIIANNTVNGVGEDLNFNTDSQASSIHDNGGNIIEYYTGSSIMLSSVTNILGDQANLNLSSTLAINDASTGVETLALSSGSVAIDAGLSAVNGVVSVPTLDQRGATRSGTTDIGAFEFGGTGLPIELVSFDAIPDDHNDVLLHWVTATEKDNDHFEIYRSSNLKDWELLHVENGAGNSLETLSYQTWDRNPKIGINYYVLKQVDTDGKSETFKTISVELLGLNTPFMYPNPARSVVYFSEAADAPYVVRDMTGKIWLSGTQISGNNPISVEPLESGSYTIEIEGKIYPFMKL